MIDNYRSLFIQQVLPTGVTKKSLFQSVVKTLFAVFLSTRLAPPITVLKPTPLTRLNVIKLCVSHFPHITPS
jgi:hypothetical protein